MTTRVQKIRLGVFIVLAILVFLGAVGTLAGIKLFNPRDRYYVRFTESVSGLEVGSTVKMRGVRVGQVEKIIVGTDAESVIVTLAMEPETPIMISTRAVMTTIGITGMQFVELTGGSKRSAAILPNTPKSFITVGSSTLQTLTGKAESIAVKMEGLINNLLTMTNEANRTRFRSLLDHTDQLAVTTDNVIKENRPKIKRIFNNLDQTTKLIEKSAKTFSQLMDENTANLRQALTSAARAALSVERAAQGLQPKVTLNAITSAANSVRQRIDDPAITKTIASLNTASTRLAQLSDELDKVVRQRDRQLGGIMRNLDRAAEYLKDFSRSIKERPSLLLRGETLKEKDIP